MTKKLNHTSLYILQYKILPLNLHTRNAYPFLLKYRIEHSNIFLCFLCCNNTQAKWNYSTFVMVNKYYLFLFRLDATIQSFTWSDRMKGR